MLVPRFLYSVFPRQLYVLGHIFSRRPTLNSPTLGDSYRSDDSDRSSNFSSHSAILRAKKTRSDAYYVFGG